MVTSHYQHLNLDGCKQFQEMWVNVFHFMEDAYTLFLTCFASVSDWSVQRGKRRPISPYFKLWLTGQSPSYQGRRYEGWRILKSDASAWVGSLRFSGNTFIWIIVRITHRDKAIYLPSIVESSISSNNALITIRCAARKE